MANHILAFQITKHFMTMFLPQAQIGSIVRLDAAIFRMIPGTSCLASVVLSLRDKNHSTIQSRKETVSQKTGALGA
jgi:hypothetical protein